MTAFNKYLDGLWRHDRYQGEAQGPFLRAASHPYVLLVSSFLFLIVAGGLLIKIPYFSRHAAPSWIDAFFTSTSAVCVTGLTVRSTGQDFNALGQGLILALIQVGGIGIMTLSTLLAVQLRRKANPFAHRLLSDAQGTVDPKDMPAVARKVITYIAVFEGLGAAILFVRFLFDKPAQSGWTGHIFDSAWNAIFHSVSAFCNAGFALWDDSLMRYSTDVVVNMVIMILIVAGGLGFFILTDLHKVLGDWLSRQRVNWGFQLKLTLLGTAILTLSSTAFFVFLEAGNPEIGGRMSEGGFLLECLFQSVTSRTAGFNTLDLNMLEPASILVMLCLMFVGAAPGGTAGGIKITTFWVLLAQIAGVLRPHHEPSIMGKSFSRISVRSAVALTCCAFLLIIVSTGILLVSEENLPHHQSRGAFLDVLFETISAFGTVGLTLGLTAHLSVLGKGVIMVLMFLGRVGPLGFLIPLLRRQGYRVEYPSVNIPIG